MGQPSSKDEMTVRHQFDRLCQMALKGEAVNYYKHMDYRRKHEVTFSELSEKELSKLFTMDEYGTENHHFEVHGYDIEVKNTLIAERVKGKMVPIWEKYMLTVDEAVQYFGIGEKKIRMLISENTDTDYCFTVQVGNKSLINRHKFEEFLNQTTSL